MLEFTPADGGPVKLTGVPVEIRTDVGVMSSLLYRAPIERAPAIIICPGGMGTGLFEVMEWVGSKLSALGITGLTISWRAASPADDVKDISAALTWLIEQGHASPNRIGVFGTSRGGNAALRAAALEPRLQAVVTLGAVVDFLLNARCVAAYSPGRAAMIRAWLGDPVAERGFFERVSAITYASRISVPTLLIHGQHDMLSPPEQSVMMKNAINVDGKENAELFLVPYMGHYGDVVPNGYAFNFLSAKVHEFLTRVWRTE